MVKLFSWLLSWACFIRIINAESQISSKYGWLDYPQCPNMDCKISVFEFCAAASIGKLFDEYIQSLGFLYPVQQSQYANTKMKAALIEDTESIFCSGLWIRRHLTSLFNTQNVEKTGVAMDLLVVLEKTELHKLIHKYPFWPLSYHMNIKKQRRKFFQNLPCNKQLDEPWILKNNEHKGKGIVFLYNTENMRKLFLTNNDFKYALKHRKQTLFHNCNGSKPMNRFTIPEIEEFGFAKDDIDRIAHVVKGDTYIAQRYVSDTLLINQHKFGIRMFIVVLSMNPYIVLCSDGYISINLQTFDAQFINKENVLSNREMSEKAEKAEKSDTEDEEEWNWSYQQFGEYLDSKDDIHFDIHHVRNELVNAANLTFQSILKENGKFSKSTKNKIKQYVKPAISQKIIDKKDNNYMWLAADFLLTTDGDVKLLEINLHPGTRYIDHCSWKNEDEISYHDWQCQQGRNITKEIVDVTLEMAFRKVNSMPFDKQMLQNMLSFHNILIYRKF